MLRRLDRAGIPVLQECHLVMLQRLTDPEMTVAATALRLSGQHSQLLQVMSDDMLALLGGGTDRYVWLAPTAVEHAYIAASSRGTRTNSHGRRTPGELDQCAPCRRVNSQPRPGGSGSADPAEQRALLLGAGHHEPGEASSRMPRDDRVEHGPAGAADAAGDHQVQPDVARLRQELQQRQPAGSSSPPATRS